MISPLHDMEEISSASDKLAAWVAALTEANAKRAAKLESFIANDPEIAVAVLALACSRLSEALDRLAASGSGPSLGPLLEAACAQTKLLGAMAESRMAIPEANKLSPALPAETIPLRDEEPPAEMNSAQEWLVRCVADAHPSPGQASYRQAQEGIEGQSRKLSQEQPQEAALLAESGASPGSLVAKPTDIAGNPKGTVTVIAPPQRQETARSTEKPSPSKPGITHLEQLRTNLFDLQKVVSWGNKEEEHKARERIMAMSSIFPKEELTRRMNIALQRGLDFKRTLESFQSLVAEHGILGAKVVNYWASLPGSKVTWFIGRAEKEIKNNLTLRLKDLLRMYGQQSPEVQKFIAKAQHSYGELAFELQNIRKASNAMVPTVVPVLDHRIQRQRPCTSWTLYLDETGDRFGSTGNREGRIVGLLVPQASSLQPLPEGFHAKDCPPSEVLLRLNQLLASPCGIFGLCVDDLHPMTREHWLASILEVVNWVWRLLPLPEKTSTQVTLDVLIENKGTYTADKDLEWLSTGLAISWDKESPKRNSRVRLGRLEFVPKDTGLISWVDLPAFCWGSSNHLVATGLNQSRLHGSCLLKGVGQLLPVWAKGIRGDALEGTEWQLLTEQKDADREGSLTQLALRRLMQLCRENPSHWQRYVDTMNAYLASKRYDLAVVERQAKWLAGMEGMKLSPEMRFFWKMAELANYNHKGEISSQAMRSAMGEVERLAGKIGQLMPHVECHAALRLAVADTNAFDFKAAERRLACWDERGGGHLLGSALWDGKILSSLGQLAAFQEDSQSALSLFDQSLEQFRILEGIDQAEAVRQRSQTATYAAIAAMDAADMPLADVRRRMEAALGCTVSEAATKLGGEAAPGDRYLHHILVRYLVRLGTPEEKASYARTSATWLVPEIGMGAGHPWPLIQYYRSHLTDSPGHARDLLNSMFSYAWGQDHGATVKFIGLALGIASGFLAPEQAKVREDLDVLQDLMPQASAKIAVLKNPGEIKGMDLLARTLPFNYR